jgi:hypothetical protein
MGATFRGRHEGFAVQIARSNVFPQSGLASHMSTRLQQETVQFLLQAVAVKERELQTQLGRFRRDKVESELRILTERLQFALDFVASTRGPRSEAKYSQGKEIAA